MLTLSYTPVGDNHHAMVIISHTTIDLHQPTQTAGADKAIVLQACFDVGNLVEDILSFLVVV